MLKTLLAATTALTLMSGVGFAETTYSNATTEATSPSHGVDVTKTTRKSADLGGVSVEKRKTVDSNVDRDHDRAMMDRDRMGHHDLDRDRTMAQRDKTVTKNTNVSPDGSVSKDKTESTTVR